MKNIAFFTRDMKIGGMEKALVTLLNELVRNNYKITLFLQEKEGVLLSDLDQKIKVKKLYNSKSSNVIIRKAQNYFFRLLWILRYKNRFYFSCNYATYFTQGSVLALKASKNSMLYVHSDYYNLYDKDVNKVRDFFKEQRISKFSKISFVSNESLESISKIIPNQKEKMIVLNNLFDYITVEKISDEKIEYKFDENKKNIIFIGRLENESKDLKYLLTLANEMKNEKIDFIIIGGGKDENLCKSLINLNNLENVKMLGEKTNPYPYLNQADALIITSNYEGNPIVFNEARLFNKKIISTIKVKDKYSSVDEKNALIIEKGDISNSDRIVKYLNKKYDNIQIDFEEVYNKRLKDILTEIER